MVGLMVVINEVNQQQVGVVFPPEMQGRLTAHPIGPRSLQGVLKSPCEFFK